MDDLWLAECKGLTIAEMWEKLYNRVAPENHLSLWIEKEKPRNSEALLALLPVILKRYNVKSFLDVGCSNRYWIKNVDWSDIRYVGIDIVKQIVDINKSLWTDLEFYRVNPIEESIKEYGDFDMIFIRNMLIHNTLHGCKSILENVKQSGATYLMASTSPEIEENIDNKAIWVQKRNLQIEPFNLPEPWDLIPEMIKTFKVRENNYMGIWSVKDL